jgi:hypothetical protein
VLTLAGATGGTATISRSVAEIPSAINQLLDRILEHYSVEVALPADRDKIDVTLKTQQGNPLTHRSRFVLAD